MNKTEHHAWCVQQVKRLSCLPFPPSQAEGLNEIVNALERWTLNEAHATAVINTILEDVGTVRWPTPAVIRQVAFDTRPPTQQQPTEYKPKCRPCGDSGLVGAAGVFARCSCPEGQSIRQDVLDHINGIREPKKTKKKLPAEIPPVTQADIDQAVRKLHEQKGADTTP